LLVEMTLAAAATHELTARRSTVARSANQRQALGGSGEDLDAQKAGELKTLKVR
jgi:hypothetical protein